jgi:hypothetical protein
MLRFFVVCVKRLVQRCYLTTSKYWFPLVMKERLYFGKIRLVMPLDMAIKMLNLNAN